MQLLKKLNKKNSFLTGAAVLALAGLICRALGVLFRIPLANIVGNFGLGLYQMVYPLYSLLLIISSAGVPVAISKMVAREKVNNDVGACKKILLNAIVMLGAIGIAVSSLFMIFAFQIAKLQGNENVGIIYLAIAPSVFLVCIISAFRGYFQGLQNMIPTAASQIIEQLVKVTAGVILALLFIKISVVWAVFGSILAVTISEIIALGFLIAVYFLRKKKIKNKKDAYTEEESKRSGTNGKEKNLPNLPELTKIKLSKSLMWGIIKQSFPVTLMASIFPLILVFDSMVVINMLSAAGADKTTATQLFGISSGAVHALINLPAVLGVAIATAVVPTVSSLLKQEKMDELRTKCALAIKITFLISLFFVVFYLIFSERIIDLLYHGAFKESPAQLKIAGKLMMIESALVLLMGISAVFTAMLQGADKAYMPLIALTIGGAAKIIFELAFIKTQMGIYAVSVGNIICFFIAAIFNTIFALRYVKIKKGLAFVTLKAVGLAVVFSLAVWTLSGILPKNRWFVLLSGSIALIFYVLLVFVLKFFDKKEKKVFNKINVGNNSDNKKEKKNEKSRVR